jgi:hypothetical protein
LSVDYSLTVRNNRLTQVVNAIDGGTTNGYLRLLDGRGSTISSFQLSRPCGLVSGGVLTFSGMSLIDPAASGSSYAVAARTGPTSDIIMNPTNFITAGQTVALTAATITGN